MTGSFCNSSDFYIGIIHGGTMVFSPVLVILETAYSSRQRRHYRCSSLPRGNVVILSDKNSLELVFKECYNFSQFRYCDLKVRQGEQSTIRLQKKEICGIQSNEVSWKFGTSLIFWHRIWQCNIVCLSLLEVINLTCLRSYVSLSSICILRKRLNNFLLFFVAKYPLFYSTLAEQFDTFISLETLKTAEYISKVDFARDQCFLQTGHLSSRKSIFSKRKSICFKIWIDKRNKCFFNPIFICCKLKPSRNLL